MADIHESVMGSLFSMVMDQESTGARYEVKSSMLTTELIPSSRGMSNL